MAGEILSAVHNKPAVIFAAGLSLWMTPASCLDSPVCGELVDCGASKGKRSLSALYERLQLL